MAKGNVNPADAHRKALRKKELKKNKAKRTETRDFSLVKKDTSELEDEIKSLEAIPETSAIQRARLVDIKSELEKINKKKEAWVEEHPEQRGLIYRSCRREEEARAPPPAKRNYFKKNGLPRHPERSIYYDAQLNPFGVAPPGMPYAQRALLPGEVDSEEEEEGSDDDFALPAGPPPGSNAEEVDSDDDIQMPEGPAPGEAGPSTLPAPPPSFVYPPPPPGAYPMPPPGFPLSAHNFPPPPGFPMSGYPAPPPGFPGPPTGQMQIPSFPPTNYPPPGFFNRREQGFSSRQDPLSGIPHETFQAHRANLPPPPSSANLPPRPPQPSNPEITKAATVFAEPQLRDFKKEATAFVPASLKRKKAPGPVGINAAPSCDEGAVESEGPVAPALVKPDLLGSLKSQFGPGPSTLKANEGPPAKKANHGAATVKEGQDDYAKFVKSMGDILK